MLAQGHTRPIGHGQCEIRGDPLLQRPHRDEMHSALSLVTPDLELDVDPALQMRHSARDPGPALVGKVDIVAEELLGLSVELDVEEGAADDGGALALVVGGDGEGAGPEANAEDADEDEEGGAGADGREGGGLGFEGGGVLGLVDG